MHAETLISLITLGIFIWAVIWSHSAFRRYEERDEAKVKALQRIAVAVQSKQGDKKIGDIDNPSANW